jgi:GGDEF domain-containing protein
MTLWKGNGGGEFLVLMPGGDSVAVLVRADRIRSAVKPIDTSAKARTTMLSMGVAVADGGQRNAPSNMLCADYE